MTTFDDREQAFENRFAHDQELAFRAQARRNRNIGLWAAQRLGKAGSEAEAYASEILTQSIEKDGTEAIVSRLHRDLVAHGLSMSEHQVRRRMDELMSEAVDHVRTA